MVGVCLFTVLNPSPKSGAEVPYGVQLEVRIAAWETLHLHQAHEIVIIKT